MTLKVYYDEVDGQLIPKWILLPVPPSGPRPYYSLASPVERFFPEDLTDDLRLITVTLGALTRDPNHELRFFVNIDQLKHDLIGQRINPELINYADFFVLLVDDLQELLNFEIHNVPINILT